MKKVTRADLEARLRGLEAGMDVLTRDVLEKKADIDRQAGAIKEVKHWLDVAAGLK